jgi:T5orf172 domain
MKYQRKKNYNNHQNNSKGWVYIITNPMHELIKIGFTTEKPEDRASQLDGTSIAGKHKVIFAILVDNAYQCEQKIHHILDDYRVDNNREWFKVSAAKAVETIKSVPDKIYDEIRKHGHGYHPQSGSKELSILKNITMDADSKLTFNPQEAKRVFEDDFEIRYLEFVGDSSNSAIDKEYFFKFIHHTKSIQTGLIKSRLGLYKLSTANLFYWADSNGSIPTNLNASGILTYKQSNIEKIDNNFQYIPKFLSDIYPSFREAQEQAMSDNVNLKNGKQNDLSYAEQVVTDNKVLIIFSAFVLIVAFVYQITSKNNIQPYISASNMQADKTVAPINQQIAVNPNQKVIVQNDNIVSSDITNKKDNAQNESTIDVQKQVLQDILELETLVITDNDNLSSDNTDMLNKEMPPFMNWNYDIFWCEAEDQNESSNSQAEAEAAKYELEKSGITGSINIRLLKSELYANPDNGLYISSKYQIRPNSEELDASNFVKKIIFEGMSVQLDEKISGSTTPQYLSLFFCNNALKSE